ncbi:MAG: FAD-dependent monooxygenase [Caulobacteraceae bacterium]|nr:FAD-dependent monooxygenase [Caulobacteraceae bacterium]
MSDCDVLVVGAGPTGLVLALWLRKLGVRLRIVDRAASPGTTSRALAVQARTLELYRQADLADAVLAEGRITPAVNLWARGEPVARVDFARAGEGVTPFPFLHIYPQDDHERLLIKRLARAGVHVEREISLAGFVDEEDAVRATLTGPGGEQTVRARYIAGCDGAHSVVRERIGGGFPGGVYRQLFYVADVVASGPPVNGELHVDLDEADFLFVFPLAGEGRARLVGTVRDERADDPDALRFDDVSRRAIENLKINVETVNWFSTYRVHHRVTERFRGGRAFVLGDAAHIHSPAGGQGMNTGIGDAINLAWKLAAVLEGRAPDTLLDSYEAERIGFARRLVATTDRGFSLATADGSLAKVVRTRLFPPILSQVVRAPAARAFMYRTVSQITLNYRGGPLSEGRAGAVRGGDRLPWLGALGVDNHAPLSALVWQVHVYGDPNEGLAAWCAEGGIPLHAFDWRETFAAAGLARGAAYLVRPDTYVALADPSPSAEAMSRYFATRGLKSV